MITENLQYSTPRFDRHFFESNAEIAWIGDGSFGGKAGGLALIRNTLHQKIEKEEFPDIELCLPRMIVLRTSVFDSFMKRNNLYELAFSTEPDFRIITGFLKADFPAEILGDLRFLIENVKIPLAIRSSSLLEDAKHEPFAGTYATKMISNNQPDIDARFQKLIEAIKFVYASTYFREAKDYFKASSNEVENEKMAIIIQEVVGENNNLRYYPHFSGVAKSYNFYPIGRAKPEHGVVNLALGLGKTIVDGGIAWRYSPAFPKAPSPFGDPQEMFKTTQNTFWAVNMDPLVSYDPTQENEFLSVYNIQEADYDNTIKYLASTYDRNSNKISLGVEAEGPRILNYAPLLHLNEFGFNNFIKKLINVCEESFNNPIEIEFAATIPRNHKKIKFGFLQVRPMAVSQEVIEVDEKELFDENLLVASDRVMGNGSNNKLCDVVFAKPDKFLKQHTVQIAKEIESINRELIGEKRNYVLIGFGRWGSCDPWLGIPVEWGRIGGARVIVESTLFDINVELSQGSHFFHNLNSFKVSYFSINFDGKFKIDWNWLNKQNVVNETEFVKHVSLDNPLSVKVDGRTGRGIILKSISGRKNGE